MMRTWLHCFNVGGGINPHPCVVDAVNIESLLDSGGLALLKVCLATCCTDFVLINATHASFFLLSRPHEPGLVGPCKVGCSWYNVRQLTIDRGTICTGGPNIPLA
jgi:hypothetical protein